MFDVHDEEDDSKCAARPTANTDSDDDKDESDNSDNEGESIN